ncbi:MAG TPA: MOSC N-terminal beta barrel domain-containing protein [Solirubrobacteraceae bacterium]|nr:MOSC N-terminal beta barrel domain-containing protein [Solirubrobacteraceae bacterium]
MSVEARVLALSLTPVKGLRIVNVDQIALEAGGVRGDRRFYLVEERGRLVNGKHAGALNEVVAEIEDGGAAEILSMRFPDGSSVSAPVELGEQLDTDFYRRTRPAQVVDGPFAQALSRHVGERLRLVRAIDGDSAIDRGGKGGVSLISSASLGALARVADRPSVDGRRFRMTIELDGVEPFAEDSWLGRTVEIGDGSVLVHGHVGRCIVTTKHPDSGVADLPTLDLLRAFRANTDTTEPLPFGVYGEVTRPGVVRVGDRVEV